MRGLNRQLRQGVAAAAVLVACLGLAASASGPRQQSYGGAVSSQQGVPGTATTRTPLESADPALDSSVARMRDKQERTVNEERHRRMVADADKLLELTTELKTEVDKSSKNETPADAFQKAAEIERLAHDVKERIRS